MKMLGWTCGISNGGKGGSGGYDEPIEAVSLVALLSSLSRLTFRFIGEDDRGCGYQNGGSSSLGCPFVRLRPRCIGVACTLSLAATPFKSSIIPKSPSRTPSASFRPAAKICGLLNCPIPSSKFLGVPPPASWCSNFVSEFCRTCSCLAVPVSLSCCLVHCCFKKSSSDSARASSSRNSTTRRSWKAIRVKKVAFASSRVETSSRVERVGLVTARSWA